MSDNTVTIETTVTPTPGEIRRRFNAAGKIMKDFAGIDPQDRLAEYGAKIMRERIRETHKGVDGKKLARYSKGYAKQKGVSRGAVDLTVSGDLLDSVTGEWEKSDTIVFFPEGSHHADVSNAQLMLWHFSGVGSGEGEQGRDASGRFTEGPRDGMPARPAFGFMEREQTLLAGVVLNLVDSVAVPRLRAALRTLGA